MPCFIKIRSVKCNFDDWLTIGLFQVGSRVGQTKFESSGTLDYGTDSCTWKIWHAAPSLTASFPCLLFLVLSSPVF